MTPERHRQIGDLYHAALAVDAQQRSAFLERACAGDSTLRCEVESLLESHEQGADFIAAPALMVAAELLAGSEAAQLIGRTIARYKILSMIGAGGMGRVYLAEDTELGRRVALKLLPEHFTNDQSQVQRFRHEARTASALNHPNILTVHEVGQVDGQEFIATEYVEGETLRARLTRAPLGVREVLDVAVQVAEALVAAHQAGIVHRDIKPENVMIRRDGYVKVLDFGLAKLIEKPAGLRPADFETPNRMPIRTNPGVVMGTPEYMSPEQARGLATDARTDVWSLGVVVYEMLACARPFGGGSHSDIVVSILEREPVPLFSYVPDTPAELERIVTKALAKDREERYQTVKDLAIDLRRLRRRLDVQAEMDRSAQSAPSSSQSGETSVLSSTAQHSEPVQTAIQSRARTSRANAPHKTLSVEYVVGKIKRHRLVSGLLIAAFLVLLGAVGYGLYTHRLGAAPQAFQTVKIARLTATGKVKDAAVSPDGKYIVYMEEIARQRSLWIRQVATGSTVQIAPPLDVGYVDMTFSNDSNYIYYLTGEPLSPLYQVPTLGGTSKKVIDRVDSAVTSSPDGRRLAFLRADPARGVSSLVVANVDGTGEQTLASRQTPDFFLYEGVSRISWSPDGKIIACPAGSTDSNGPYFNVVGVQVADGAAKMLGSQRWAWLSQVAWLTDGSGLIFVAKEEEVSPSQLWRLSYPLGQVQRITNDLNQYDDVSLTADSKMLVTVQSKRTSNIWVAPQGDAARARQITFGTSDSSLGLSWMPDGKIVYESDASGRPQIWVVNADGSERKQLTAAGYNYRAAIISSGRYIVFHSFRDGVTNIWRMDLDGGNLKQLTYGKRNFFPDISPDGQWIVYSSFDSGDLTLWKVSIDGGEARRLNDTLANLPSISPDGKYIASFYWDEKATPPQGVMIFPSQGGQPIRRLNIVPDAINGFALHWSPDGLDLLHLDENLSNIWSHPVNGGAPTQLTNFEGDLIFNFAWSHDGKSLALARGTVSYDVVLISDLR